jgi:hypothetical protein
VIFARKVPHALSTDKNVSKLVSSLSDAHAKEGSTHVRQSNVSINTATILFFFKIYPLLNNEMSKKNKEAPSGGVKTACKEPPLISLC